MKRFKEFLKKKNINPYDMVHGSHAHENKLHEMEDPRNKLGRRTSTPFNAGGDGVLDIGSPGTINPNMFKMTPGKLNVPLKYEPVSPQNAPSRTGENTPPLNYFQTGGETGSVYAHHSDASTIRLKNSSGEGSGILQPQSNKTIFMKPSDVENIGYAHNKGQMGVTLTPHPEKPDTHVILQRNSDYGPYKAKSIVSGSETPYEKHPAVGLTPVEIFHPSNEGPRGPRGVHWGHEITEVIPNSKLHEAWSSNQNIPGIYVLNKPKSPGMFSRLLSKTTRALKLTGPTTDDWKSENDNSHIGNDLNSVHQTLSGQAQDLSKHPDLKELVRYTQWSKDLNNALRTHGVNRTTPPETVEGINTTKLDNLVNNSRTQQSMTVYHGPGFHPLELAQRHPNLEFTNPGYTSTSIDKPTARRFGSIYLEQGGKQVPYADVPTASRDDEKHRHVMSINVPQGHPGLYIGNQTLPEYEHLLPRNTTFRLRSTTPRTYRDVSENGGKNGYTHVWDFDVVPEEKQ